MGERIVGQAWSGNISERSDSEAFDAHAIGEENTFGTGICQI
jgi:hypothetical protein